eukprot:gene553-300_t
MSTVKLTQAGNPVYFGFTPQKMEVPPPWDRQEKPRGHEGIQNDLYDILGWRDTKRTAIALSVCWGVWYFLILGASNVVTSICRLCLCLMVVGVFHRTGIAPGVLPEQRLLRAHDAVSAATLVGSLVFMFIFRSLSYSTGFLLLIILAFGISPFFLRQDLKNIVLKKLSEGSPAPHNRYRCSCPLRINETQEPTNRDRATLFPMDGATLSTRQTGATLRVEEAQEPLVRAGRLLRAGLVLRLSGSYLFYWPPSSPRPAAQLKPPNLARRRHLKPRKEPVKENYPLTSFSGNAYFVLFNLLFEAGDMRVWQRFDVTYRDPYMLMWRTVAFATDDRSIASSLFFTISSFYFVGKGKECYLPETDTVVSQTKDLTVDILCNFLSYIYTYIYIYIYSFSGIFFCFLFVLRLNLCSKLNFVKEIIESTQICVPTTMQALLHDVRTTSVQDALRYRKPKVSIFLLVMALLMWYLLLQGTTNYLGTGSRLINFFLCVGLLDRLGFLDMSFERVEKRWDWLAASGKRGIRKILPALRWERPASSMVVFGMALVVHVIAPYMSYSSASLILILFLFSGPYVYYRNRPKIEKLLKKANSTANNAIKKGKSAAEEAKEKLKDGRDVAAVTVKRGAEAVGEMAGTQLEARRGQQALRSGEALTSGVQKDSKKGRHGVVKSTSLEEVSCVVEASAGGGGLPPSPSWLQDGERPYKARGFC